MNDSYLNTKYITTSIYINQDTPKGRLNKISISLLQKLVAKQIYGVM